MRRALFFLGKYVDREPLTAPFQEAAKLNNILITLFFCKDYDITSDDCVSLLDYFEECIDISPAAEIMVLTLGYMYDANNEATAMTKQMCFAEQYPKMNKALSALLKRVRKKEQPAIATAQIALKIYQKPHTQIPEQLTATPVFNDTGQNKKPFTFWKPSESIAAARDWFQHLGL